MCSVCDTSSGWTFGTHAHFWLCTMPKKQTNKEKQKTNHVYTVTEMVGAGQGRWVLILKCTELSDAK